MYGEMFYRSLSSLKPHWFISLQFYRSEVGAWLPWFLCSGPHKTEIKVQARLQFHWELGIVFQAHAGC